MLCVLASLGATGVWDGGVIFNYTEDLKWQMATFERIARAWRSGVEVEVRCWGIDGCARYADELNATCEEYAGYDLSRA